MPCYEVNLISVEFKAANEDLLKKAAESLGYTFEKMLRSGTIILHGYRSIEAITIANGQAIGQSQDAINALKRAYSLETIKQAAKVKGWSGNWAELKTKNTVTVKKF